MGNTWKTVETNKNPKGIAQITVGEKKCRIEFEDGSINKKFLLEDLPDYPRNLKTGRYFVTLDKEKSEVTRIGPANLRGLRVRCVDFVRPEEGADPEPKEYTGKNKKSGKEFSYRAFTVLLEVQKGDFKGCVIPSFISYLFTDDGTGTAAFADTSSKYLEYLQEFCEATGITEEEMPYEENLLPAMLARVLQYKREFEIDVKNGYPVSIFSEDDYETDDDITDVDDVDEDFPVEEETEEEPVKPVKKAKKEVVEEDLDDDL